MVGRKKIRFALGVLLVLLTLLAVDSWFGLPGKSWCKRILGGSSLPETLEINLNVSPENRPKTVQQAVDRLILAMSPSSRKAFAAIKQNELIALHLNIGMLVRNEFGLWSDNEELLGDCSRYELIIQGMNITYQYSPTNRSHRIHPDDASCIIIDKAWQRLQKK